MTRKKVTTVSVIIVDDHPIVRAGMRMALQAADDIAVLAEGATGADALRLVAQHRPHVLVLDVSLPDTNGVEVTRQLREQGTPTAILVLTVHSDRTTVLGLLENGAAGYVLKDEALETLAQAVRAVAKGESWLSASVASQVVRSAIGQDDPPTRQASPLTLREIEVLNLLAQGLDNAAIAERLVVTKRTVQNHVSNIYGKLGVDSRTQAALYAIRNGIAPAPSPDEHG
jgi:NarL family two-component system response regulator LiaR